MGEAEAAMLLGFNRAVDWKTASPKGGFIKKPGGILAKSG
jgi:hypothetical protein